MSEQQLAVTVRSLWADRCASCQPSCEEGIIFICISRVRKLRRERPAYVPLATELVRAGREFGLQDSA